MNAGMNPDEFYFLRDIPILLGAFFVLTAAIGVVRFPDLYSRLHASSKLVTLGSLGLFIGAAFALQDTVAFSRLGAVLLFQFITTPLSAYLIAKAAYLRGIPVELHKEVDEWGIGGVVKGPRMLRPTDDVAEAASGQAKQQDSQPTTEQAIDKASEKASEQASAEAEPSVLGPAASKVRPTE